MNIDLTEEEVKLIEKALSYWNEADFYRKDAEVTAALKEKLSRE